MELKVITEKSYRLKEYGFAPSNEIEVVFMGNDLHLDEAIEAGLVSEEEISLDDTEYESESLLERITVFDLPESGIVFFYIKVKGKKFHIYDCIKCYDNIYHPIE